jgi:hypothetical protein
MSWFPQIGAGSIAQFPLRRSRRWRLIENNLESGERITLPDVAAREIEWRLTYHELTNIEAGKINDLFAASSGAFGSFTFVDPMANLLGWSGDLSRPDWATGLLRCTKGANDPVGTQTAWSVTNGSPGDQCMRQNLGISGDYVGCFSVYVWSDPSGSITLQRDQNTMTGTISPIWKRLFLSGAGSIGAQQSEFSIVLAPGQTISIWGIQVEAQPYPSQYKPTTTASGIYEETYFGMDELKIISTGPGLSSCDVTLVSRG